MNMKYSVIILLFFILTPLSAVSAEEAAPITEFIAGCLDASGEPLSGGVVYFYSAGTTNPKSIYGTKEKTGAVTSITLDSVGRATSVKYASGLYKVVLKTNTGVAVATYDNVRFGTPPNVDGVFASDYDTFAEALTAAANQTLIISSNVSIASDTTIPETVHLMFYLGGKFSISTGVVLTVNGPITAGGFQIFDCASLTSRVIGTMTGTEHINAKWFGATGDGLTDDRDAIQSALDYCAWGGAVTTLFVPKGDYLIGNGTGGQGLEIGSLRQNGLSGVTSNNNRTNVIGSSGTRTTTEGTVFIRNINGPCFVLGGDWTSGGTNENAFTITIAVPGIESSHTFRDFTIKADTSVIPVATQELQAICPTGIAGAFRYSKFENLRFVSLWYGVLSGIGSYCDYNQFDHCAIDAVYRGVDLRSGDAVAFVDCRFGSSAGAGMAAPVSGGGRALYFNGGNPSLYSCAFNYFKGIDVYCANVRTINIVGIHDESAAAFFYCTDNPAGDGSLEVDNLTTVANIIGSDFGSLETNEITMFSGRSLNINGCNFYNVTETATPHITSGYAYVDVRNCRFEDADGYDMSDTISITISGDVALSGTVHYDQGNKRTSVAQMRFTERNSTAAGTGSVTSGARMYVQPIGDYGNELVVRLETAEITLKQSNYIPDATGSSDAHTIVNQVLDLLQDQGLLQTAP